MHVKAHPLQNANEIKKTDDMKMTSILFHVMAASLQIESLPIIGLVDVYQDDIYVNFITQV